MRCWPRTRPERWRLPPPLTSRAAPRSVRGRPSGLQAAAHRCATALRAGLDPGDHCGPWAAATTGQAQGPAPGSARHPHPGRPPSIVTTERVIYRQRCNDPLSLAPKTLPVSRGSPAGTGTRDRASPPGPHAPAGLGAEDPSHLAATEPGGQLFSVCQRHGVAVRLLVDAPLEACTELLVSLRPDLHRGPPGSSPTPGSQRGCFPFTGAPVPEATWHRPEPGTQRHANYPSQTIRLRKPPGLAVGAVGGHRSGLRRGARYR